MLYTTILVTLFSAQGILASPFPAALPSNETATAPTILKNPLRPATSELPAMKRRMAPCPGTENVGIATPLGKGVKCPSTADVKGFVPVAPPAKEKREANAQLDALPLDSVTDALGGGLPVKEKRQLDALPLDSVTDALGGGLPVKEKRQLDALTGLLGGGKNGSSTLPIKEKRQLDALPLDTVTDALGGGLPVKEKRQLDALPLDTVTDALGGGLPVKEKRQLDALTGLLGGGKNGSATLPIKE